MVGCGHSLECRGGGRRVDNAPQAESSRHDGTICVPSGGTAVPQKLRRYHPCTLRRYDGATPVPSGGTTVPALYLQEVRRYHSCTWRWYACEIPVFFLTDITPGKMTVVPRAGTRVVPLYIVQVQGRYRCTSCRYKGGTVIAARGALSILLHFIHLFCNFIKRPGEAGSSSIASSELTPLRIGAPLHFPILEASSCVTPTT